MKKVLVVDDSSVVRMSLDMLLKENGYDVTTANDGTEGVTAAKNDNFDLIITDINMPNMNGFDLIKNVREMDNCKFLPILVLTTESDSEMLKKGKNYGATGWIVKPFTNESLLETVLKVIG
jgi:two-component system chemotaxis response regulator CheY